MFLRDHGPHSTRDIAAQLEMGRPSVGRAVARLLKGGFIEVENPYSPEPPLYRYVGGGGGGSR